MYPRNAASPPEIAVGPVVQISDGALQTSGTTTKVKPKGGSWTAAGGTTSFGDGGTAAYIPTQAETNYESFMVEIYKSGCTPASITVVTTESATAGRVSLGSILGSALTETSAGYLAAAIKKFFDVATPVGTINSLPGAAPDAAGGLPISDAGGLDMDAKLANTNEVTAARMGALTDLIDGGRLDLLVDAMKLVLDRLATGMEADGAVYRFTTNALEQAPVGSGLDAAGVRTAIGLASANLDTQLSAVPAAVRDVSNAAPASGSLGEKVNSAASAGDPLASNVPGAYAAGTAGYILGTNLDAKVSEAGGETAPTAEEIRQEMDSNSTKLTSINAKTANLPTDPADQSLIIAATDAIISAVGTPMQAGSPVAVSDKTGFKLASDGLDAVAAPADVSTDAEARASFTSMVRAVFNRMYNKVTQTSTQQVIHNDSNSAVSTKAVSYDGVTQTLGKSS